MSRSHDCIKVMAAALAVLLLNGCYFMPKEAGSVDQTRKLYIHQIRQLAPEPVYARLRTVHLPEPLPERSIPENDAAVILPVFEFQVAGVTIEEAARVLAATARYSSYCAAPVAKQHLTLTALGTIDELAAQIGAQAQVAVTVDHSNREVRVMALNSGSQGAIEPRLFEEQKVEKYEHKSNN